MKWTRPSESCVKANCLTQIGPLIAFVRVGSMISGGLRVLSISHKEAIAFVHRDISYWSDVSPICAWEAY